jgi:hypothetical protein
MCWIPHRWCVKAERMAAASDETLSPDLLPLSYEYLGCRSFVELASIANTSFHHSRTTSTFLSQALDFGPFESSNSNTLASLQYFLTSHINNFKSPIPQRPAHKTCSHFFHSMPQRTLKSRAHEVVHTTTPPFTGKPRSYWPVHCMRHPGPGSLRERWHPRTNKTS